jgi:hypothetical protein
VDFEDPSGSAASGRITYNMNVSDGQIRGSGTVSASAAGGTLRFTIVVPGVNFRVGLTLPLVLSLVNELGIQSNELAGEFRTPSP